MAPRLAPLRNATPWRRLPALLRDWARGDGYLYFRSLVPRAEVAALRWRVMDSFDGDPAEAPLTHEAWVTLQQRVLASPEFAAIRELDGMRAAVQAVCGPDVLWQQGDLCRVVPARAAATRSHQDAAYLAAPGTWVCWIPLTDCPLTGGPLAVSPGSHLWGLLPHGGGSAGAEPPRGTVWAAADLSAGDAIFFSDLTLHRTLENRGSVTRLSIELRFRAAPP